MVERDGYAADGKSPAFQESAAWSPRDLKIGQSRRDQNHQGLAFAYDGAGRLTEAARPPRPLDGVANNSVADPARLEGVEDTTKFEYDAAHNLLEVTRLESGVAHQEEAPIDSSGRNRPASIGGIPLQWDANGNLVEKGDVRFHYDYQNRLARVSGAEGDLVTFTYDALGRRVRKNSGGVVVKEVWDGWQSIEEYRNGQLAQRRVYGGDLDEVVHTAVDLNGDGVPERTYVPLYDSSGHLALTTDDSGKPIERYEYGAFGNPRVEPGRMILADESPPFVEQLRLFEGALLLEVSEEVLSDRLSEAASAGDLRLVGTQSGEVIPFSVAQPIASGAQARRRIVVTPGTLPVAGTEVTLTVGSRALQDLFHNTAASDFAQTFSWPAADALLYDGAAPRVGLVAVRAGILEIELTEEPDLAAAQSLITVNGAATPWTLGPDRYTLIATSALAEGSHELAIAMGALDLAGSGLAETFNATVPVAAAEPESIVFRAQDPREIAGSAIGNRFGFHGLPGEEEVRLLYVRNRYYDPELGRFITPDPMGYKDGPNPYQYALNDPANHHDPMGLNKGRIDGKKNEKSGNENADIRDKIARITELKSRLAALKKKIAKREFELALRIAVFGMEDQEARETLGGILRGFGFLVSDVTSVMSAILGPAGNCGDAVGQINCRLAKTAPAVRSMEWVVSTSAMMFITSGTMLGFLDDAVNPAVWRGIVPRGVMPTPSAGSIRNLSGNLDEAANAARTQPYYPMPPEPKWRLGSFKSVQKWQNQMQARGWTPRQITEAIQAGQQFPATNLVNQGNAATRHVHPATGRSVVVDNVTLEVLHVGGDAFLY